MFLTDLTSSIFAPLITSTRDPDFHIWKEGTDLTPSLFIRALASGATSPIHLRKTTSSNLVLSSKYFGKTSLQGPHHVVE